MPTNTDRAAELITALADWYATRPAVQLRRVTPLSPVPYTITPAGLAALERDPSTDIPHEPRRASRRKPARHLRRAA